MSVKRDTPAERKAMPLASGVLDYFPDALLVVAEVSRVGNEQHHPGEPLHWDKSKSTDEADALLRHLIDRGTLDSDGQRHSAKVAWRALALLQRELDAEAAEPVAEGHVLADGTTCRHDKATFIEQAPDSDEGSDVDLFQPTVYGMSRAYGRGQPQWCRECGYWSGQHNLTCPLFHAQP